MLAGTPQSELFRSVLDRLLMIGVAMAEQINNALRIIRRKQLEERTGLSRSTIYSRINPKSSSYDPEFPKPIDLGHGMQNPPVGWVESEVDTWLQGQAQKRRNAA